MTKNKNTEKYIVKQEQPYVYDVWGILFGLDAENLKDLYLNQRTKACIFFPKERLANSFVKSQCPQEIDGNQIHYKVVHLRAFFAELLPVEVKADGK